MGHPVPTIAQLKLNADYRLLCSHQTEKSANMDYGNIREQWHGGTCWSAKYFAILKNVLL